MTNKPELFPDAYLWRWRDSDGNHFCVHKHRGEFRVTIQRNIGDQVRGLESVVPSDEAAVRDLGTTVLLLTHQMDAKLMQEGLVPLAHALGVYGVMGEKSFGPEGY